MPLDIIVDEPCEFHIDNPGVNRAEELLRYIEQLKYDDCIYHEGEWHCGHGSI